MEFSVVFYSLEIIFLHITTYIFSNSWYSYYYYFSLILIYIILPYDSRSFVYVECLTDEGVMFTFPFFFCCLICCFIFFFVFIPTWIHIWVRETRRIFYTFIYLHCVVVSGWCDGMVKKMFNTYSGCWEKKITSSYFLLPLK